MKLYTTLRILADSYQQVQKTRLGMESRVRAIDQGMDEDGTVLDRWIKWAKDLQAIEDEIKDDMKEEMQYHPAWPFLERVKGISFVLGAQLVGLIGDIGDFDNISKLWRFSLGAPQEDGKVERRVKGEKLHYSHRLKRLLYVIGSSFLKSNSPYRRLYDEAKTYYQENRDWTKLHIHYAAMRKMNKILLSHLWLAWRKAVNLPTRPPYVLEHTEHTTMIEMEEFLEPKKR